MLTPDPRNQILCGNAATLNTIAKSLERRGQPYKMVKVVNPVTHTTSPGIEFSKDVYNDMVGEA